MIYIEILGGFILAGAVFAILRRLGQSSKSRDNNGLHIV